MPATINNNLPCQLPNISLKLEDIECGEYFVFDGGNYEQHYILQKTDEDTDFNQIRCVDITDGVIVSYNSDTPVRLVNVEINIKNIV